MISQDWIQRYLHVHLHDRHTEREINRLYGLANDVNYLPSLM